MSNPPNESQMQAIRSSLYEGNKIGAIKLYREAAGVGLKEAKEAVDRLESGLRAASPDLFKHAAKEGCAGMLVMLAGLVILLGLLAT